MKKNLCVTINTSCNWDCNYCISETNLHSNADKKKRSQEELYIKAYNILNTIDPSEYDTITLSGGEPGLLPEAKLLELLRIGYSRGFNIDINSNGQVLKYIIPAIMDYVNQPFELVSDEVWYKLELIKMIDTVDIHLAPTMEEGIKTIDAGLFYKIIYNNQLNASMLSLISVRNNLANVGIKVRPLMVIGKSDLPFLESFILTYTNIYNPAITNMKLELRICVDNESGNNPEKLSITEILAAIRIIYKYRGTVSEDSLTLAEAALESRKLNRYS